MKRYRGIIYTLLSAAIFGFTPILTRLTYDGGANGITMVFLRAFLSLPVLLALLLGMKIPLGLQKKQILQVLPVGIIGLAFTTICLYTAYSYIGVGLSTTLHYVYPIFVIVSYVLFFKQKAGWMKWLALGAGMAGVVLMLQPGQKGNLIGIGLAVLSGATYAYYMIAIDRTGLKDMHYFKLTFYLCILSSLTSFLFGAATDNLAFPKTPTAWFYALLVSLLVSVAGLALLQRGIALAGPSDVSILFTVEPITSVLLGALILREPLSARTLVGVALILASVVLVALADRNRPKTQPSA
ncbi:DMT family transporter [Ruminococcaceae bacterium OttesenSCG-928-I18]|nr:DMT family transporter [Ruminococcaceae bacterium OttesenSCG-928-I18]